MRLITLVSRGLSARLRLSASQTATPAVRALAQQARLAATRSLLDALHLFDYPMNFSLIYFCMSQCSERDVLFCKMVT
jgi:hypothetical protein